MNVISDFEDMSCEMVYGQAPPPFEEDPVSKQPCYATICKYNGPLVFNRPNDFHTLTVVSCRFCSTTTKLQCVSQVPLGYTFP